MTNQRQVIRRSVSGATHTPLKLRLHPWSHTVVAIMVLLALGLPLVNAAEEKASEEAPAATQPATTRPADVNEAAPKEAAAKPEAATSEFLEKLQDDLRKVNSVQSNFKQTKQLAIFEHEVIIRGHFALEKPERLIWVVNEPVKYAVRLIGSELRQWDEDTGKVQTMQMGKEAGFQTASDQLKAWFLGDYSMLTETFDITIKQHEPLTLTFTPKAQGMAKEFLKRVDLTFGKDRLYIQKLVALEPGGDVTTIEFTDTLINKPIKASAWDMPPHE